MTATVTKGKPTPTRAEQQEKRQREPLDNQFSQVVFLGLQGKPVHEGTVVDRAKRKAANKKARQQRKENRNG